MSDPATQSAMEAAAGAGVVLALSGTIMGMQVDAVMIGFVGALVAETFMPTDFEAETAAIKRWLVVFCKMVAAGLLAGIVGPFLEAVVRGMVPATVPAQALHLAVSGAVGIAAPVIVPLIRQRVKARAEKEQ